MEKCKLNYRFYILLSIIGIAFYLLNRFSPFVNDDYYYAFIKGTNLHVNSIWDAIESQCYDYFHMNGRFLVHVIVQYFCGVLGLGIFQVVNSIVFVVLCLMTIRLLNFHSNEKEENALVLFVLMLFVFGTASIYLDYIAGAVNYLWTSAMTVVFLYYYFNIENYRYSNWLKRALLVLIAFVSGSMQESFSIGIVGALVLYYIFHLNRFRGFTAFYVLSYFIGTLICVFAPANFLRLDKSGGAGFDIMNYFVHVYNLVLNSIAFDIIIILMICSFFIKRNETISFFKSNIILFFSIFINVCFVIFIVYIGKRQLTCIELLSIILIIKWLYLFSPKLLFNKYVLIACSIILLFMYVPIYIYRYQIDRGHNELVENAKVSKDHVVVASEYCRCCIQRDNWLAKNYTRQEIYSWFSKQGLSAILTNAKDIKYIRTILPESKQYIEGVCNEKNKVSECVYKHDRDYFYIVRINTKNDYKNSTIEVRCKSTFASRIKSFFGSSDSSILDVRSISDFDHFVDGGYCYVVVYEKPSLPVLNIKIVDKC